MVLKERQLLYNLRIEGMMINMFFSFGKTKEQAEKELEGLKKAYEILNERYQKKAITLDQFRIQCDTINKKIEKLEKIIAKKSK